ncbi:carboxypeptidase M32 [Rubripirellula sp.]|jgi:carboxypeptidase Taq|nr:carboxypeptidase M32 [Planctomycetaceae bacterium]MDA9857333.1 carboxypeptidase M32 [Rubripirellula sp.]MDF1840103.1 carboxypeptidase M32 [Rubripirellula sp.]
MPDFQSRFDSVCQRAREAMQLQTAADTLEWDERTGLPHAAGEYRANQVASLRAIVHGIRTDSSYGDDLTWLMGHATDHNPHSDIRATVECLHRDWDRDRKLPNDLVQRTAEATVRGQQVWDEARKSDDFSLFRNTLNEILDLKREAGERLCEGTDRSAYEALMDEYEPNASVEDLQQVFERVRRPLVKLIEQVTQSEKQPNLKAIEGVFPVQDQRDFSHRVAEAIGFDFDRGRLDETSHPFCTTLGPHDCRILTRYDPHVLSSGLFGTLHEAGHGTYEQGLRTDWFGLPPGSYASLGIHESQSRLWENQVGRSQAFWQWLYRDTQQTFSPQLDEVGLDSFYFAINAVRPSLIRVEADEATYNLHILIRFDLERELIEGSLPIDDLPEAWNARYESDLGIRPDSDADGVLQDVHWSAGLFGYFPTYTLGNLAAAQLFATATEQIGDLDELLARGEFRPLLDWLHQRIHFHGRCFSGNELVQRACGSPLSAEPLTAYLTEKLGRLYDLPRG